MNGYTGAEIDALRSARSVANLCLGHGPACCDEPMSQDIDRSIRLHLERLVFTDHQHTGA